jgi:hypothetical protein
LDLHRMIDSQNTDGAALFVNRETRKAHTRQGQIRRNNGRCAAGWPLRTACAAVCVSGVCALGTFKKKKHSKIPTVIGRFRAKCVLFASGMISWPFSGCM